MTFDPETFRLNSPLGKRILATTRDGDYAHPGEEDGHVAAEKAGQRVGQRISHGGRPFRAGNALSMA